MQLSTLDVWDDKLVALGTRADRGAPRTRRRSAALRWPTPTRRSPAPIISRSSTGRCRCVAAIPRTPRRTPTRPLDQAAPASDIAELFRAALAARRSAELDTRADPRRPASRRPRAARARTAGEGLRLPRRVLVGRPGAPTGARPSCCAPSRACGDPVLILDDVFAELDTDRRARLADLDRRVRTGHRDRGGRGGRAARRCAHVWCGSMSGRIIAAGDGRAGGCRMTEPADGAETVPETVATYLRLRGLEPSARTYRKRRRRGPDDENAPFTPGRDPQGRRRRARRPHAERGVGLAARARGRRAHVGGGRRRGHRATHPAGRVHGGHSDRSVRLDGVGEAAPAHARAHPLGDRPRGIPEAGVDGIRFIGPDVPSWKWGPRTIPGRGPRDTYG